MVDEIDGYLGRVGGARHLVRIKCFVVTAHSFAFLSTHDLTRRRLGWRWVMWGIAEAFFFFLFWANTESGVALGWPVGVRLINGTHVEWLAASTG